MKTDYELVQQVVNIQKLFGVHFFPPSSIYLSKVVTSVLAKKSNDLKGITHGSRNGAETMLFARFTGGRVYGTDISDTADYFSDLVKIDFHDESPIISSSPTDFVFSNSWDHSNDPPRMFSRWLRDLTSQTGLLILEQHSGSGHKATVSDPYTASQDELVETVNRVIKNIPSQVEYIGSLRLDAIPSCVLESSKDGVVTGTASCLSKSDNGFNYLVDFQGRLRPLYHHLFYKYKDESDLDRAKCIINSIQLMLSSREHGMAEALFMIDPSTGMPINYELEVVKPLIGRILMAQEIQKRFYPEISFNTGATDDEVLQVVERLKERM
ncbi:class I SAM-dependent methyltransferase [Synechococcus sp. N19]|uniref:class I SAM-dependent methyltransferase n=1 Tax=Synechococcus sp. N19 TaxID=2575512 RepID=UPI0010BF6026|nr:class I SAM-dependent methyltransferase [Synechococcus sp. N19]